MVLRNSSITSLVICSRNSCEIGNAISIYRSIPGSNFRTGSLNPHCTQKRAENTFFSEHREHLSVRFLDGMERTGRPGRRSMSRRSCSASSLSSVNPTNAKSAPSFSNAGLISTDVTFMGVSSREGDCLHFAAQYLNCRQSSGGPFLQKTASITSPTTSLGEGGICSFSESVESRLPDYCMCSTLVGCSRPLCGLYPSKRCVHFSEIVKGKIKYRP